MIKHFKAEYEADKKKKASWYSGRAWQHESPLHNARTYGWKAFNPARLQYPYTKLAIQGGEPLYSRAERYAKETAASI